MKLQNIILFVIISIIFSSCATICGGKNYNALVKTNRPNAEIWINNNYIGHGYGQLSLDRINANRLNIILKEKGCEDTVFKFRSRKIRGFALAGAITPWVVLAGSFYVLFNPAFQELSGDVYFPPIGFFYGLLFSSFTIPSSLVNLINFSTMYKPDIDEFGVYKIDYKNYEYRLNSTCITKPNTFNNFSNFKGAVYLKNGNVMHGNIIELKPNISIKIQTSDGSILVFSFDEVEKFTQE